MGSEWSEDGGLDKRGQGETNKGWFTPHTNFFFSIFGIGPGEERANLERRMERETGIPGSIKDWTGSGLDG